MVQSDALKHIESILFVASEPVQTRRLAQVLEIHPKEVKELLDQLQAQYVKRGLRLQWTGQHVQLTTSPESASIVETFLGLTTTTRLSNAAQEVLAIIAYSQPITRPQIDQIRGVNSDGALRKLLHFGLIDDVGRMEAPGRPILYSTTVAFLQYFGLDQLSDLPPLSTNPKLENEITSQSSIQPDLTPNQSNI